jgi:hypothetical protein
MNDCIIQQNTGPVSVHTCGRDELGYNRPAINFHMFINRTSVHMNNTVRLRATRQRCACILSEVELVNYSLT